MFNFLKKNVNTQKITDFKWALSAINLYIYLEEWDNAKRSMDEVELKERENIV